MLTNLVAVVGMNVIVVFKAIICAFFVRDDVFGALTGDKDVVWLDIHMHHVQRVDEPEHITTRRKLVKEDKRYK